MKIIGGSYLTHRLLMIGGCVSHPDQRSFWQIKVTEREKMFKHNFIIKIYWRLMLGRKVVDIRKCSDLDPRSVLPVHSSNGRPTRCFATSSALVSYYYSYFFDFLILCTRFLEDYWIELHQIFTKDVS